MLSLTCGMQNIKQMNKYNKTDLKDIEANQSPVGKWRGKIRVEDLEVQNTTYKNYKDILYTTGNIDNIL